LNASVCALRVQLGSFLPWSWTASIRDDASGASLIQLGSAMERLNLPEMPENPDSTPHTFLAPPHLRTRNEIKAGDVLAATGTKTRTSERWLVFFLSSAFTGTGLSSTSFYLVSRRQTLQYQLISYLDVLKHPSNTVLTHPRFSRTVAGSAGIGGEIDRFQQSTHSYIDLPRSGTYFRPGPFDESDVRINCHF
jgi:hypothetical protein